jgi:hypothetical protein
MAMRVADRIDGYRDGQRSGGASAERSTVPCARGKTCRLSDGADRLARDGDLFDDGVANASRP